MKRTALPDRWLESRDIDAQDAMDIADGEIHNSGG
ncbi:hypothetical protein BC477_14930 [Clavibacter michiganensis subsp. michiganensis]|jgi:hypothetical protein|nr:hypothetical protein BC477_14930 [Clavibacter michiganensis subsp. michiganensis]OUD99867.1 hypothetical protein CMMCAS07_20545 [Clavibacter michiganensis subsp. michiganensis]